MNDRYDDEQLGQSVRDSVERNVGRVSARPNAEDLFARVGTRAARQRRSLAAAAVVFVAVASLVGYSIGTTVGGGDDQTVQTPVLGESDAGPSPSPEEPGAPGYVGTLEHLFTRTANGITMRVYTSPPTGEPNVSPGFVVAEMSNDAAVGVGRAENCDGGGVTASGTFGGPEGSPVQWVIVQSLDVPSTAGVPVHATLGGVTDEMVPFGGIAVLAVPGAGPSVLVEGPGGGGLVTIGQPIETDEAMCPPPPTPATLPPGGAQPADVAAAEAGVRQAYTDVYDNYQPDQPGVGDTATDERVRRALREAGFTDEQLAAMTVEVGEIRFTDETHAAVLFRLTIPEHADGTQEWRLGYAVFQDGRWIQAPEMKCEDLSSIGVSDVRDCPSR